MSDTRPASDSDAKAARRDALYFSISFAIVALLTGIMLAYKVAVTVSMVTSGLFYFSLAGMIFFAGRAIYLARTRTTESAAGYSSLN